MTVELYCCGCETHVTPRLTDGKEIYERRRDLHGLPFWKCDTCGNYVGCHHKTKTPNRPLGCIPTPEIRQLRKKIHARLDPMWRSGMYRRSVIYAELTVVTGHKYHTANVRTVSEANKVLDALSAMKEE